MGDTTPIPYTGDVRNSCIKQGHFGVEQFNCGSKIRLRPTPVAMVTKILTVNLL